MTTAASEPRPVYRTLVMGNQGDFLNREGFATMLRRYGLEPEWVFRGDTDRPSSLIDRIPRDCEAVVFLYEMQHEGHEVAPMVRDVCNNRRIPYINLSRKKAIAMQTLEQLGYRAAPVPPTPEKTMPAEIKAVPKSASREFTDVVAELKRTLRELSTTFHVTSVTFEAGVGVELKRVQIITEDL